jgi:Zn-dependent peptidase ImmA (M78 family)
MPFDPKKLRHDNDGVPILKATEIEQIATEVLEKHCPAVLHKPAMTPVIEIIEALEKTTDLTSVIVDLGFKGNAKILGKVNFTQRCLSLDQLLITEREIQMRFTAAHEIGHWILHRWNYKKWKFPPSDLTPDNLQDDEDSLCRLEQRSPRDWLEWQANVFAAALIMPRATFLKALIEAQILTGIKRNIGIVWVSDAGYSQRDLVSVLDRLSVVYAVSIASVRVRLNTLKLIHDEAAAKTRSAVEVLSAGILRPHG